MPNWYEFSDLLDGLPVAYFKNKSHLEKFKKKYSLKGETKKVNYPSHLEFIVKKEEKNLFASFEFELHAIAYNQEFFNGRGIIEQKKNKFI